jgi:hypothetical protein
LLGAARDHDPLGLLDGDAFETFGALVEEDRDAPARKPGLGCVDADLARELESAERAVKSERGGCERDRRDRGSEVRPASAAIRSEETHNHVAFEEGLFGTRVATFPRQERAGGIRLDVRDLLAGEDDPGAGTLESVTLAFERLGSVSGDLGLDAGGLVAVDDLQEGAFAAGETGRGAAAGQDALDVGRGFAGLARLRGGAGRGTKCREHEHANKEQRDARREREAHRAGAALACAACASQRSGAWVAWCLHLGQILASGQEREAARVT